MRRIFTLSLGILICVFSPVKAEDLGSSNVTVHYVPSFSGMLAWRLDFGISPLGQPREFIILREGTSAQFLVQTPDQYRLSSTFFAFMNRIEMSFRSSQDREDFFKLLQKLADSKIPTEMTDFEIDFEKQYFEKNTTLRSLPFEIAVFTSLFSSFGIWAKFRNLQDVDIFFLGLASPPLLIGFGMGLAAILKFQWKPIYSYTGIVVKGSTAGLAAATCVHAILALLR